MHHNLETPFLTLDLRYEKCPLNFVKTRLAIEKIPLHCFMEVWIDDDSESVANIPQSIQREGHLVIKKEPLSNGQAGIKLWIRRLK